jgi:outer membrane receptor protein involved in Fe transport
MKNNHKLLMGGVAISLLCSAPTYAQSDGFVLEEITVTARKREESLTEIPVSISVLGESLIKDAGILTQQDLFDLTPGIHYDEAVDRNSGLPSVRGVQSNEIATNRTKVSAFIDGMPVLGSQGNFNFNDVAQVEVYRGPQSAAFGRSTFGGAINYVTKDPGQELEGEVGVDLDDYGKRIINGSVGGPITDTLGFLISANIEDSDAPSEFMASDGTQYGTRTSESFSGKLVFAPTEALELEFAISHAESDDGPTVGYFISKAARDACFDGTIAVDMGSTLLANGTLDCDWSQGSAIQAQNDRAEVYAKLNPGATDDELFLASAQSEATPGTVDEKDRYALQLDYSLDDGGLIQVSTFYAEENYIRGSDGSNNSGEGVYGEAISIVPGMGYDYEVVTAGPFASAVGAIMSDPTEMEETYLEVRWVSPAENRLRWVVGGSYYDYDFLTTIYFGGYNAILQGQDAVDRYLDLTGVDVSIADQLLGESATNAGVFFNTTYDLTEKLTVTAEARYQDDEVSGEDPASGVSGSVTTSALLPRLSFNYAIDDNNSFYGQVAKGNNPGGVNVGFFDPNIANKLDGDGQDWVNYSSETFKYFDEEVLYNYELGFKGVAFDDKLSYATAIFFMDWQDQVQSVNLNWGDPALAGPLAEDYTTNRTFLNEGDLEMKGIEFEGNYKFNQNVNVRFTASYLDAEYADYCSIGLSGTGLDVDPARQVIADANQDFDCYDVSGYEVAEQPKWSGSLSPSYNAELGSNGLRWNARADIRYQSEEWLNASNTTKTVAVTTVNFSAGITSEKWDVTLYVNNLTDNDTPLRYGSGDDYTIDPADDATGYGISNRNYEITPRQQRTIGLRAGYRF